MQHVDVHYINTKLQLADILTEAFIKGYDFQRLTYFCQIHAGEFTKKAAAMLFG